MTDRAAERLLSGRAWHDYCETVRRAGHMVDHFGAEANALDCAEWYRFMTRLMRNGIERFMENCEPERPRLRNAPWRQSINFQSPDQDHLLAEFIDGSHDYVFAAIAADCPISSLLHGVRRSRAIRERWTGRRTAWRALPGSIPRRCRPPASSRHAK